MAALVTAPGGTDGREDGVPEPDGAPEPEEPPDCDVPAPGVCTGGAEAVEALPPHDADRPNKVAIDNIAAKCKLENRQTDFD